MNQRRKFVFGLACLAVFAVLGAAWLATLRNERAGVVRDPSAVLSARDGGAAPGNSAQSQAASVSGGAVAAAARAGQTARKGDTPATAPRRAFALTSSEEWIAESRRRLAADASEADRAFLAHHRILTNSPRSIEALRRDPRSIVMRNAIIDTRVIESGGPDVDIPEAYLAPEDTERFIVQFGEALSGNRQRDALVAAGAVVGHYVPNRAFCITADAETMKAVMKVQGVVHIQRYHPYFAMPPEVQDFIAKGSSAAADQEAEQGQFNALLFDNSAETQAALAKLGAGISMRAGGGNIEIATLTCKADVLDRVVKSGHVSWVEPTPVFRAMNDRAGWTTRSRTMKINHPGIDGSGVTVAVTDSGVDTTHRGFAIDPNQATAYPGVNTRIAQYVVRASDESDGLIGDEDGHGTHVAGSALGNGAWSDTVISSPGSRHGPYVQGQFQGSAPGAKLVMIEDYNSYFPPEQVSIAYNAGARLGNNSWGEESPWYDLSAMEWDGLVRDALPNTAGAQPYIAFFSAGNDGNGTSGGGGGVAGSVVSPGTAKNVITVGAVEQRRRANNLPSGDPNTDSFQLTDSDWQIADYSARGPTPDGRIKPDVVAPGTYVLSAQSSTPGAANRDTVEIDAGEFDDYKHKNVDTGPKYAFASGTSMATPLTTGIGALLYQWYTELYGKPPSPAMMKALMVSGAMDLDSIFYARQPWGGPIIFDGWGMVDLVHTVDGPRARASDEIVLFDQQDSISDVNMPVEIPYEVTDADQGGLKIVLTWTDEPGTPVAGMFLLNDLDLIVTAPDGTVYMGNLFSRMGWGTASFGFTEYDQQLGDRWNNVETIIIRTALPGAYKIQIKGYNIPFPSQDFALSITRGFSSGGENGGTDSDMVLDAQQFPVVATAVHVGNEPGGASFSSVIGVRRWVGAYGEGPEFGTWRRLRDKWFHYGPDVMDEIISGAVVGTTVSAPSVAVDKNNGKIYVAWVVSSFDDTLPDSIYLRHWNGSSWSALGGSFDNPGICEPDITEDASSPCVGVGADGNPIVAYIQSHLDAQMSSVTRIVVKRWNGTKWVTLDGTSTGVVQPSVYATSVDMWMDGGKPVLAWHEMSPNVVRVYRWTGSGWSRVGGGDLGTQPQAEPPQVVVSGGNTYVTWCEFATSMAEWQPTVRVAVSQGGGAWQGLGGSKAYPGVSGNMLPIYDPVTGMRSADEVFNPQIAAAGGKLVVAWQAGASNENRVLMKEWKGGAWVGVDGSDKNGVTLVNGQSILKSMVMNDLGHPAISYDNDRTGLYGTEVVGLAGAVQAPLFGGLVSAVGSSNNTVRLAWNEVFDPAQAIRYNIYRTASSWDAGATNIPSRTDPAVVAAVFANRTATVTDVGAAVISGLQADRVWFWGVRAVSESGLEDGNTAVRLAGPWSLLGDTDRDWLPTAQELIEGTDPARQDSDGDGMWDGWEWYYSVSNPLHTNALAMKPMDNGGDDLLTEKPLDGDPRQAPLSDLDGDGMSNIEEHTYWFNHFYLRDASDAYKADPKNWLLDPTNPDSDGDGMPDGWEYFNGLNPSDPADGASGADPDGDGLTNPEEYENGSDPYNPDTDGDGLGDGAEVAAGSNPRDPDTDRDGLQDGAEAGAGGNPLKADTDNDGVSDGDEYQLGNDNVGDPAVVNVNTLLARQDFESGEGGWTHASAVDFWHITTADPQPPSGSPVLFSDHSPTHSFRMAKDPSRANLNATYDYNGQVVQSWLMSPAVDPLGAGAVNMFVTWKEYYETESMHDVCIVEASRDGLNWFLVRAGVSGVSGGWVTRTADLSAFVGSPSVRVRFFFQSDSGINNAYRGWWVDDVMIYAGTRIQGVVRDINGAPIKGAIVYAMGRGGVTNWLDGHAFMLPGKIFGQAVAAENGFYSIDGLFQGEYYVKASFPGFKSEFWNGQLYDDSTPYHLNFGRVIHAGVNDRRLAEGSGIVDNTGLNGVSTAHFELEGGVARGSLVVMADGGPYDVYLNQTVEKSMVWNGVADTNLAAWIAYRTRGSVPPPTYPDWETDAFEPPMIGDIEEGEHIVYLHPAWTDMPMVPELRVPVRDGELTVVKVGTAQSEGEVHVIAAGSGPYAIEVDGRGPSGFLTTGTAAPTVIKLLAGDHEISLSKPGTRQWIAPRQFSVPPDGRTLLVFETNHVAFVPGSAVRVVTQDMFGDPITGAVVYVNGKALDALDTMGGALTTPLVVTNLSLGRHWGTVSKDGYRRARRRGMTVHAGITNEVVFTLLQADRDYDGVGDAAEMAGYGDLFAYSRSDDPDQDGVNNLTEFEQFNLYGVTMNLFDPDSDKDRLLDGVELGYDGRTNWLAFSTLETRSRIGDSVVNVYFRGRFLEGENAFNTNNLAAGGMVFSIEGDLMKASALAWTGDRLGTPVMNLGVDAFGAPDDVIDIGHDIFAPVFADTFPDRVDTEEDGMWDGFEFQYRPVGLNPIMSGPNEADPDNDGLTNVREFQGADRTANTNDWTNPGEQDSDGDLIPDGWEVDHGLDPLDETDATDDPDNDQLDNLGEWQNLTDPQNPDSDNDWVLDGLEVHVYRTNPMLGDSDYDGLLDGEEVVDTDLSDLNGRDGGFFPNWKAGDDLDNDGQWDGPTDWDTDGDGMPDGFEVKDVWGNNRPSDRSLDPNDPTDGDLDYDGDGLSNLAEFLVRDALIGMHPGFFNPDFAGVVWDYSTDPFNGDSDGDGMPDGWEAMRGLHPMDPVRDPQDPDGGPFLRLAILERYGDLDFDGILNINEYDIRFVWDPDISSNVLEGSTHPWETDTDGDGLGDGEEVKSFISNPLNQDTDLDGLPDGSAIPGRFGEVYSSFDIAEADRNVDQSLNDMWQLMYDIRVNYYPFWIPLTTNFVGDNPPARWGGALAQVRYTVRDNAAGNYVGRPVGEQVVAGQQVLLNNENIMLFGGRSGVQHFNEIWRYNDETWTLMPEALWYPPPLMPVQNADAEIAVAVKTYSTDVPFGPPNVIPPVVRPRPGGPPSYMFYDGNPDTDPLAIWGEDGVNNWERIAVIGGWYPDHSYASPFSVTDADEFGLTLSRYYKSPDNEAVVVTYGWRSLSDAYQWYSMRNGTATDHDLNDNIWIGATSNDLLFTGICVDQVLNTAGSLGVTSILRARLTLEVKNTGPAFNVKLVGELDKLSQETIANQGEHETLIAPDTYHTETDGGVVIYPRRNRPWARYLGPMGGGGDVNWAFNTTNDVSVTISNSPNFRVMTFDVTELVREMLNARVSNNPRIEWELGNNMGFLFVGDTNEAVAAGADVVALARERSAVLYLDIENPHYNSPQHLPPWPETFSEGGRRQTRLDGGWITPPWPNGSPPPPVMSPAGRKSTAVAYSPVLDRFVMFGGVDGVRPLEDTWVTADTLDPWFDMGLPPEASPPARWGHAMVASPAGVVIFGGFDSRNRPMNDLWEFDGVRWTEITTYGYRGLNPVSGQTEFWRDNERPRPRGGHAMGIAGPYTCLYGGTDGNRYFNDTWVLELSTIDLNGNPVRVARWINIYLMNELSRGPSPRAFPCYNNNGDRLTVFGGRIGTLPTSKDSDADWVGDGLEVELGGPAAGRDPRLNALYGGAATVSEIAQERIPYSYKILGGVLYGQPAHLTAVMDFESLSYYVDGLHPIIDQIHADPFHFALPLEGHHPWGVLPVWAAGYDAYASSFTMLWWHRFGGGDPLDPRDVWELGPPVAGNLEPNMVPASAYSGRWCYGTALSGAYPDNAVMELYSPLFDLTLPSGNSTDPNNLNGFFLVFHEWLDLADENDIVRVDAVRPVTPADVLTRTSTSSPPPGYKARPNVVIVPPRNNAKNTRGEWRRVIVPLETIANEANIYFKFTLQSDAAGHTGGWYIDDVAIIQAGEISGLYDFGGEIKLFGIDSTNAIAVATNGPNNEFGFNLLPTGQYRVVTPSGSSTDVSLDLGVWSVDTGPLAKGEIVLNIAVWNGSAIKSDASPMNLSWNSVPGQRYEVQYTTPEELVAGGNPWRTLAVIDASAFSMEYSDYGSDQEHARLYRVILKQSD